MVAPPIFCTGPSFLDHYNFCLCQPKLEARSVLFFTCVLVFILRENEREANPLLMSGRRDCQPTRSAKLTVTSKH